MSTDGNGRLSFLLRPQRNSKGQYHVGRSNLKGTIDLEGKIIFAYPQKDGSLIITIEEYDGSSKKTETLSNRHG